MHFSCMAYFDFLNFFFFLLFILYRSLSVLFFLLLSFWYSVLNTKYESKSNEETEKKKWIYYINFETYAMWACKVVASRFHCISFSQPSMISFFLERIYTCFVVGWLMLNIYIEDIIYQMKIDKRKARTFWYVYVI